MSDQSPTENRRTMMTTATPKLARENLARARAYMRRNEIVRSLESACSAFVEILDSRLIGQARYEVEVLIQEYITELNKHPEIKNFFFKKNIHATPYIRFIKGRERDCLERLESILHGIKEESENAREKREERHFSKKQELLERGRKLMEAKDYARGKGVLRRVAEGWGQEEGLITEIAMLFLEHHLCMEAADLFEQAIELNPADSKAYGGAVRCYKELHEFEKCEKLYLRALKQFGSHPRTLLNMAELYKRWRKPDEAYDFARRALSADPTLEEAKAIIKEMEARIF